MSENIEGLVNKIYKEGYGDKGYDWDECISQFRELHKDEEFVKYHKSVIEVFKQYLEENPNIESNNELYANLGKSYLLIGKKAEALEIYKKLLGAYTSGYNFR